MEEMNGIFRNKFFVEKFTSKKENKEQDSRNLGGLHVYLQCRNLRYVIMICLINGILNFVIYKHVL